MLVSHYELLNISLAVIDTMKVPESPIWLAGTKIDGEPHPISDQTEKQGLVVHCRFTHTLPSQGEVLVAGTPWCGKKKPTGASGPSSNIDKWSTGGPHILDRFDRENVSPPTHDTLHRMRHGNQLWHQSLGDVLMVIPQQEALSAENDG